VLDTNSVISNHQTTPLSSCSRGQDTQQISKGQLVFDTPLLEATDMGESCPPVLLACCHRPRWDIPDPARQPAEEDQGSSQAVRAPWRSHHSPSSFVSSASSSSTSSICSSWPVEEWAAWVQQPLFPLALHRPRCQDNCSRPRVRPRGDVATGERNSSSEGIGLGSNLYPRAALCAWAGQKK